MKIQFKPEVEQQLSKLFDGLKELGITVEMPPKIWIDTNEVHTVGRYTPYTTGYARGQINIVIPDHMVDIDKVNK